MALNVRQRERLITILQQKPQTVADVIDIMNAILTCLPLENGIAIFVKLYRDVTVALEVKCRAKKWRDPDWLQCLIVIFACLFFDPLLEWAQHGSSGSASWDVLFNAGENPFVMGAQFVLAGMCAHILFDLGKAVALTCIERNVVPSWNSPQHGDFQEVNKTLLTEEIRALPELVDAWLRAICRAVDSDGTRVMAVVALARGQAFRDGIAYYEYRLESEAAAETYCAALDRQAAAIARALLFPTRALFTFGFATNPFTSWFEQTFPAVLDSRV